MSNGEGKGQAARMDEVPSRKWSPSGTRVIFPFSPFFPQITPAFKQRRVVLIKSAAARIHTIHSDEDNAARARAPSLQQELLSTASWQRGVC